jgi:uncharacterized protein YkwD
MIGNAPGSGRNGLLIRLVVLFLGTSAFAIFIQTMPVATASDAIASAPPIATPTISATNGWRPNGPSRKGAMALAFSARRFLPVVGKPLLPTPTPTASPGQQAINRANLYRDYVGGVPLQLSPSLAAASQNHAQYYLDNATDSSAMLNGAHGEVTGKPDFTGVWPWDRDAAAGYPAGSGIGEDMHFLGNPVAAIDSWMFTVYHRVLLLTPDYYYAGYGLRQSASQNVDVMDLATGPLPSGMVASGFVGFQVYPANAQTGVPTFWTGGEGPSPLPPGAPLPVGLPITIQGVGGALAVSLAELRDGSGSLVPTYPNPPDCASFGCYALIPIAPLAPNTTYSVHVVGLVGLTAADQTSHFTTGGMSGEGLIQSTTDSPATRR